MLLEAKSSIRNGFGAVESLDAALLFPASEHDQHDQRCNPPFSAAAMVVLAYCGYRVAC
jgi:hypothetical protein